MTNDPLFPLSQDALVKRVRRYLRRTEQMHVVVVRGHAATSVFAHSNPWGYSWASPEDMLLWARENDLVTVYEYLA
jgi:hypothetical protein